jgi:methylamine dehydrogenase accessory protein MauD
MSFGFYSTYVGLWVLVILQTLVLFGLLRQMLEIKQRLSELRADGGTRYLRLGSRAPDFSAVELRSGQRVRRTDLLGHKSILLFLSPKCQTCDNLATEIHGIYHKADGRLLAVCQGEREECLRFMQGHGVNIPVLLDPDSTISEAFRIDGTPMAVLLDDEVRVRSYGYPKKGEDLEKIFERPLEERPESESISELPAA